MGSAFMSRGGGGNSKPNLVTGSGDITVTLVDNTEYLYDNVTKLEINFPSENPKSFECWMEIKIGSSNITAGFPNTARFINTDSTIFSANTTYEISIKNGTVVYAAVL